MGNSWFVTETVDDSRFVTMDKLDISLFHNSDLEDNPSSKNWTSLHRSNTGALFQSKNVKLWRPGCYAPMERVTNGVRLL